MSKRRMTAYDVTNEGFYKLYKFLFDDEFLKPLGITAKVLYSLLRDRHELSLQNNWVDGKGSVYLIYTRDNMADMLGCSLPTVRKAFNELVAVGLVEEEQRGANKPNAIFLNIVESDRKNVSVRTERMFQSGQKECFSQDRKNLSPNKTDINKTNRDGDKPPRSPNFTPPTIEEVAEYCRERKNTINPQNFVSFYESKGWMIGKNKMKNWKQAVITWEGREPKEEPRRYEKLD